MGQRRFVHTVDTFARLVVSLGDVRARGVVLGVAPHSLRAATPDEIEAVAALVPAAPIHIHAAEQAREVADCIAWSGARPVAWLLDHAAVDARWCIVHATHVDADETRRLAASGATAGLAPTTEADLGDGTFPARPFLDAGGGFGVGSDSNTIVDPFAELRQLEWSQRLARQSRNVLAGAAEPVGQALYANAARGGARALAQPVGAIAAGCRADIVVLDGDDPALVGAAPDTLLDAAIFGPCRRPVRDVMVKGHWVVRDGRHPREDAVLRRYRAAIAGLHRPMSVDGFDLVVTSAHLATMAGTEPYGTLRGGAVAITGSRIAWVGAAGELPPAARGAKTLDAGGRWVTPGLIDCHTHLVYAGNRANEFERRLEGESYADIAQERRRHRGDRARDTRGVGGNARRGEPAAARGARGRWRDDSRDQVGLRPRHGDRAPDARCGARRGRGGRRRRPHDAVGRACAAAGIYAAAAAITSTSSAARRFPTAARERFADAVDAFCETIGFTPEETRRVFAAARAHGLPVKLHADQLTDSGGAALAAEFGALSADHLEYTSEAGVAAMARAGTVAVLLPGAFHMLRETQRPPVEALRAHGVPVAVATDCNPGTSPVTSLVLMLNFACTLFGLTPAEALAGATTHAARALGLRDRGTIAAGQRADLALWDIAEPAELAYALGGNPCAGVIRAGAVARWVGVR